jgi:hypothetical protein
VLLAERRDPTQGALLRHWLQQAVVPAFSGRILAVERCSATALVHSLVVVTRNLADFEATGVPLLNPWRRGRADQPRWRPTPAHAHRAHAVPVGLEGTV